MNWLDIVIIVLIVVPTLIGIKIGLVKSILPLGGIMLGVFLAGQHYEPVADWLSSWLENEDQSKLLAFAIIFIGVLAGTALIASIINKILSLLLLGWIDRLGGALFGLSIGSLIAATLLVAVTMFQFSAIEETVQESKITAFFLDNFPFVLGFLPEEFDSVRHFFG